MSYFGALQKIDYVAISRSSDKCKRNQFVKLKLLPILKTNVFELYVHRQVKTVLQIVKR